jgi:hypothetical protein
MSETRKIAAILVANVVNYSRLAGADEDRTRAAWTAQSDGPTYLAGLEPVFDGMRKAGVPEQ